MVGLSGSVSESTVVEAPEKSVGRVRLVSVFRKRGGVFKGGWDSRDVSWIWVVSESDDSLARKGGEGGRHKAHSNGRTCVHRTDLGPWASQKWVRASCKEGQFPVGLVMRRVSLMWRGIPWPCGMVMRAKLQIADCAIWRNDVMSAPDLP
jgi:hypothetical protein